MYDTKDLDRLDIKPTLDEEGQGLSEYAIVVGVIVAVAVVGVLLFGEQLGSLWTGINETVGSVLTSVTS